MKGNFQPYTLNVDLFNNTYRALGGIQKYIEMRLQGKAYRLIGKHFGFTAQRAHQIGRALEGQGLLPKRAGIEENIVRNIVKEAKNG